MVAISSSIKQLIFELSAINKIKSNLNEFIYDHTENRLVAEEKCLSALPSSEYLHVAHLSTSNGLKNLPAFSSTEVCPHHLLLNLDNCSSSKKRLKCSLCSK